MKEIKFVGLHAHSGVGSPFDGFGYPEDHMNFCFENGGEALALTDHGNMNGFAYQVLHAKKMAKEGKDFKAIFGVEAYFISDVNEWRKQYEEHKADKKKSKELSDKQSGVNVEEEGATKSKGRSINRSRHLVLLAMNQTGLNNIFNMISESYSEKYFYRKPRMDYNLLAKYSDGVIAMSACLGGVYAGCYWENIEDGEEAVLECMRETTRTMVGIFGDRWYGELQWNAVPEQHALNKYIIQMHKEFGIPLVSTADSHYPTPTAWKDRELYKRLGWLGRGAPEWLDMTLPGAVSDMDYELYPKNGDQMWDDYLKYSKGYDYEDELVLRSIEQSHNIAFNRIEQFLPDTTVRLPDFVVPAGRDEDDYLRDLSLGGLKLLSKHNPEYTSRLNHELKVIADRGFSKYFLTMKAISDKTNEVQIAGPGRGSAAGSLVAYALGITQVDPIQYGLLFSRFLRSDATDYPDIDYDVSDPMVLKDMLIEEWGDDVVVPISNWNTLQLRSLLKDISKFYEIPFNEVNAVTNVMMKEATPAAKRKHGIRAGVYTPTFEETIEFSESLRDFLNKYPHVAEHVMALHGSYRSCSRHAGGVVVGEKLNQFMPLISSKGVRQTPWSEGQNVRQLEPLGFIKFDILGLSTLRMIEGCIERVLREQGNPDPSFKEIKAFYDEFLHPDKIDLNNQDIYENIFHEGKWAGIFQFTEKGAQGFAKRAQPNSIIDIAAITSIYRPGPLSAGVDKQYVRAINDTLSIKYLHPLVEEVTKETYGFLIFQEQIAMLAYKLGEGITMDEANLLRKVLTKKGTGKGHEVKEQIKEKFLRGCLNKDISREDANELWATFEYFSGYGFNKSHAVSYSIISYQCAWLYNYFPAEWMCSFLDREPDTRKEKAINIAKSHGFTICPIDINTSGENWESDGNQSLIAPLTTIKGLGEKAIEEIVVHRPFDVVEDLLFNDDIVYRKLNKKSLDALARGGALDCLIDDRFTGSEHFWSACCMDRPKNRKKFAENLERYKEAGDFSKNDRVEFLSELTGIFPLSLVASQEVQDSLKRFCVPPISEFDAEIGACWGIPRNLNLRKSKNGKWFAVIDLIDSNSKLTKLRYWGVNKDTIRDEILLNEVYVIKPQFSEGWGFSTRGHVDRAWKRMTLNREE
jgi:DNA polymerase III subunit alpha